MNESERTHDGPPAEKRGRAGALPRLVVKLAAAALVLFLALRFVVGFYRVGGNGMYPAVRDGDLFVAYRLGELYNQDVIAYETAEGVAFGRIVARPGDTVGGDENGLIVNGAHPMEEIFYPTQMTGLDIELPVTLAEGEVFVLNDFRSDLRDSRTYGPIPAQAIRGKLILALRVRGF